MDFNKAIEDIKAVFPDNHIVIDVYANGEWCISIKDITEKDIIKT